MMDKFHIDRSQDHLEGLLTWVNVVGGFNWEEFQQIDHETLCVVLSNIQGLDHVQHGDLEFVVQNLEALLNLKRRTNLLKKERKQTSANTVADIIQLILGYAVQGDRKEECVAQIMQLDSSVQQFLMVEVETALQKCSFINSSPPSPSPFASSPMPKSPHPKTRTTTTTTPGSSSSATSIGFDGSSKLTVGNQGRMKKLLRENNAIRHENEQLVADNNNLQEQLDEMKEELQKQRQEMKETILRVECEHQDNLQQKEALFEQKSSEKDKEISKLKAIVDTMSRDSNVVGALRDQVEVLTAQAQEVAKKDAQIQRLKEKLLNSSDLSKQLKQMEDANEKLLQKTMHVEEMEQELGKLKLDLSRCKEALTETKMNLSETKFLLKEKSQQYHDLERAFEQAQRVESEMMQENLSLQLAKNDDDEHDDGVQQADLGFTELNPKLREDLQRLERENKALKAQVNEQSEEYVANLRFENEHLSSVNERLEEKLRCETQNLKRETAARLQAESICRKLENEIAQLHQEIERWKQKQEDLENEMVRTNQVHEKEAYELTCRHVAVESVEAIFQNLQNQFVLGRLKEIEHTRKDREVKLEQDLEQHRYLTGKLEKTCQDLSERNHDHVHKLEYLTSQLHEAQDAFEHEKNICFRAKSAAERFRNERDQLALQNGQLRRQLKTLQVQKSSSGGNGSGQGGGEDQDLIKEVQRLMALVDSMSKGEKSNLATSSNGAPTSSGGGGHSYNENNKGVAELVASYEDRIESLHREANVLSLAKANEVIVRKEAEQKLTKVEKKMEEVTAENVSLRLKLERLKVSQEFQRPPKPQPTQHQTHHQHVLAENNNNNNNNNKRTSIPQMKKDETTPVATEEQQAKQMGPSSANTTTRTTPMKTSEMLDDSEKENCAQQ